ncbi:MAG: vWA domain-containing protein, partial [Planktothrix sp.]
FKCPLVECNKDSIEQDIIAVSMIIDESGSMSFPISLTDTTKRLNAARVSANSFVDGLGNGDEVMLHTFSDFLSKRVDWTTDKKKVKDAIDEITPLQGTSMESSLIRVLQEVEQKSASKKYIVILTDGEDTDDFTSIYDVYEAIEENKQSGQPVPIFTIALSLIDTTALKNLQEIAVRSNGKFFSANNSDS